MSRKHYVALAHILCRNMIASQVADDADAKDAKLPTGHYHRALVRQLAYDIATYCASDNANFNRDRFLEACGMPTAVDFSRNVD